MKKKRFLLIILISTLTLLIGVVTLAIICSKIKENDSLSDSISENSSHSNGELESIEAGTNVDIRHMANVFKVSSEWPDEKTARVMISIDGDVSISNYRIGFRFDPRVMRLTKYDLDVGLYSPVVNPEMIDGVIKWLGGRNDVIEMTWASANNCSKPGTIIVIEFDVLDKSIDSLPVVLSVEEIGCLNDSNIVEKPMYSIDDSGL